MSRRSLGGFQFYPDDDGYVWVYSRTEMLGGYSVDRYADGVFGSEWMRQFVEEAEG